GARAIAVACAWRTARRGGPAGRPGLGAAASAAGATDGARHGCRVGHRARRAPVAGDRHRRGTPAAAWPGARQRDPRHGARAAAALRRCDDRRRCGRASVGGGGAVVTRRRSIPCLAAAVLLAVMAAPAVAQTPTSPQELSVQIEGVGTLSAPLQIVVLMTLLTFVPAALVMMTSFTRIAIVFHFMRQALGLQEVPSNQMVIGLTLFLTAFVMAPTISRINELAIQPVVAGEIDVITAIERGTPALRDFMLRQTRETDLALFAGMAQIDQPTTPEDLPMRVVIPAFAISELKTGFQMGFFLFVPFLLVDLVVSTVLLSV